MAAPPAAHLEQFAAASNRIGDPGRRLGRPADELPHAPFFAGEPMRRAIGFLDPVGQLPMRLFGQTQLAHMVPTIPARQRKVDDARGHSRSSR